MAQIHRKILRKRVDSLELCKIRILLNSEQDPCVRTSVSIYEKYDQSGKLENERFNVVTISKALKQIVWARNTDLAVEWYFLLEICQW